MERGFYCDRVPAQTMLVRTSQPGGALLHRMPPTTAAAVWISRAHKHPLLPAGLLLQTSRTALPWLLDAGPRALLALIVRQSQWDVRNNRRCAATISAAFVGP